MSKTRRSLTAISSDSKPISAIRLRYNTINGNVDYFINTVVVVGKGQAYFVTASGIKGIGPRVAKVGDQLCMLYGAIILFILRP